MNVTITNLIENSNENLKSYIILQKTECMRQINDKIFESTNDFVYENEIYDGELLCKRDEKIYLFLGYDTKLKYEVYIPILFNPLNISVNTNV